MCGIFGVYGHEDAAALTQLGLYSLQHRGQESAGIVAVDHSGRARVSRAMGLVSEGFGDEEMAALRGAIGVGIRVTAPPAHRRSRMHNRFSPGFVADTLHSHTTAISPTLLSCVVSSKTKERSSRQRWTLK